MSCNRFVEAWGSAEGRAKKHGPATRLATGAMLFASVLANDPATTSGLALTLVTVTGWYLAVRPPKLLIGPLLMFALTVFLPFFFLTPWVQPHSDINLLIPMPWAVASRIALKGTAALLISAWTASTLEMHELERAMARLRFPRALAELLMQIIHQAHAMSEETRAISQSIRVRGATMGFRSLMALAAALPQVWLPRVLYRTDRIGDAMELRGYEIETRPVQSARPHPGDRTMAAMGCIVLLGAIAIRVMGV